MSNKVIRRFVLALISGGLLSLAFAPFNLYPLAVLSPALLFFLWWDLPVKSSFLIGFVYGFSQFLVGVSWVYVSLHVYGHMPTWLAGLSVALFVGLLALFPAIVGAIQALLRQSGGIWSGFFHLVLVAPVLWIGMEWVRGWIFSGFPWLSLGYSQVGHLFANLAPWMGVYGVGLTTAIVAGLLASLFRCRHKLIRNTALGGICGIVLLAWSAGSIEWATPNGSPLQITLVQGNVGLTDKWNPAKRIEILESYLSLSSLHPNSELIIWPEAAIPIYVDQLPENFLKSLRRHPADFVFGALEQQSSNSNLNVYNSAVGIGNNGPIQFYRKRHLVPFGEYLPLDFVLKGLLHFLKIPMSDFSAWKGNQAPFHLAGHKLGLTICFEDAFQSEVVSALPEADLLVNTSEDAWFGNSFAPHQRLQIAQMRSLETARPMLRAANTGISAVIDHRGKIVQQSRQFERLTLSAMVQPMQGVTPFVRFGNASVLILLLVLLIVGVSIPKLLNRNA